MCVYIYIYIHLYVYMYICDVPVLVRFRVVARELLWNGNVYGANAHTDICAHTHTCAHDERHSHA